MKKIPTSSFRRTAKMVHGATKIGVKGAKRAFLSKRESIEKIDSEIGQIIFENISLLKGTAVKVAQALALHNILPPSIQEELSKSYNAITPINRALVIKLIRNEFGEPYHEVFQKFELQPFAGASLGQVHRATLKNGKEVAVKIQYPSMEQTIKSDIALMKRFGKLRKRVIDVIEEVEERLYEEIDYGLELENGKFFRKRLSSQNVVIPKPFPKYSTKRVLTTEYIAGEDLYSWLKTQPSLEDKTKIANQIFSIFVKSLFELQIIQADPNPANYIITPDNRLAMVDFGCVKRFDKQFIRDFKRMLQVYKSDSRELVLQAYKDIGLIDEVSDIDSKLYKKILKFNRWSVEPFLSDRYIFTKEYLKKGVEFAGLFTNKPFNVVKDYVFSDRSMHGLFGLFEEMGVEIDMREFRKYYLRR